MNDKTMQEILKLAFEIEQKAKESGNQEIQVLARQLTSVLHNTNR